MARNPFLTQAGCGGLLFLIAFGGIVNACTPVSDYTARPEPTSEYTSGSSPSLSPTPTPTDTLTPGQPTPGTALAVLETLVVQAPGPQTGYDRDEQYGDAWIDVDMNGCDTRNDILRRDFEQILRAESCLVYEGIIDDPYTGATIAFTRGRTSSMAVQIDHIVALSESWKTGAASWSPQLRIAFANDPLNLVAVDGPTNSSKGDDSAAWWLPPNRNVWCWFVATQVSVKAEYQLWITPDEKVAMVQVLNTCPTQPAFTTDYPERVAAGTLDVN